VDLEIRVLGRVDALVDGQPLPLGGSKQRAILAMLALRANRTVSADDLIDGLWGDRPPASAAKNVQLYVSRLRKALSADGSGAAIVTRGRGYELQLPSDAVDAARFERLVERARAEAEQGIVDGAARGALELWRGAPLADVASEPFARAEIGRLEELHLRATGLSIDAELAAGRHADVLGRLEALIVEHPLHERFHAQRMLALYRAGRQSEAMEAYRDAHRTLVEEIGVEPGPELRELQEAILRHDPALAARPLPHELPRQLEGGSPLLAGRDRELRWLRKRWQEAEAGRSRVALLCGPPGIGKTRLAAELAAELQRTGAAVHYATGAGSRDSALRALRAAEESEHPTLLVLDDADDASPAVLDAAVALTQPRDSALLLLVLHQDEQGPPAFARLEAKGAAQRSILRPLRPQAAAEIAQLYEPADGAAMPLEALTAESQGVPLRVHRAASGWAQAQAAARPEATVGRTATERGDLRATEAEVAAGVADLQVARERSRLYVLEEPIDPGAPEVCPFRGLAPFDSAHAEYFFGRERLVAALAARLVGSTLMAVVGPSGSGKSSVVRAGLLPSLADGVLPGSERWPQVLMRPGERPLAELRRAVARVAPGEGEGDGDDPLAGSLASLRPDERLVLAVDQLEEIFTACRDEAERAAFTEALAALADDADQRVVVILAIRGDFCGRCAEYAALSEPMSANTMFVGPMRRDELRRAIELPARRAGLRVEPRLVSALIGEVADEPGGLPLLSTTLVELWEERSGRTLHRASYDASGGVSGAVARLAERAYRRLSAPQRERARAILLRLTDAEQPAPVRRRVPLSELEAERDEGTARALAVLTESRLVTVDEGSVEVAHEALLREWPRLRSWLDEDAEGRRLHQHLIHAAGEWQASGRDPGELYRGARLAAALDWAAEHDPELNQLEREFLDESRAASEREAERQRRTNRRLTALLAGVGVLLAAAVVAGVIALSERQGARDAATVADAQRLGAAALNEDRLDQALLLANAGAALDDSVATRSNLLSTLLRSPAAIGVLSGDGDPFTSSALSPDGGTLAVGDEDGTVTLFDTETREPLGDHQAPGRPVFSLAFDPGGDSLALAASAGAARPVARRGRVRPRSDLPGFVKILDADTARVRSSISLGRRPEGANLGVFVAVNYGPDGRSLIVTYSGGDIDRTTGVFMRRFDARDAAPLGRAVRVAPRSTTQGPISSPDGRLVVSSDKATYVVDAETLRVVRRYPVGALTAGISADGSTLAVEDVEGSLRVLDLASGRVRTLAGAAAGVRPSRFIGEDATFGIGAFSPDGRTLATWDENENVILWDVREGVPTETFEGHAADAGIQVFSPDGRTLYTADGDSGVIIWDVAGDRRLGRPFRTGFVHETGEEFPPPFAISPDGRTLAVARLDGRVDLIDAETLRRTGGFEAFDGRSAVAIEYAPDGRTLAVAGGGGGVGVWEAGSGRLLGPLLRSPRGPVADNLHNVQALAFGPDNLLAAAEVGGAVRTWDVGRRELAGPPLHLPPAVLGLAFSPDGSQLAIPFGAILSESDGIEVRDVRSGERLASRSFEGEVRTVAFSPDGGLLAGGQLDGTALLWATDGWRRVGALPAVRSGIQALAVAFSPDGRTLATSHDDGAIVLWDVASQRPISSPLPGPTDTLTTARFTPDGSRLFVLQDDGRAFRWEVDPAAWRRHACAVAGGGLTPDQWEEVVPEQEYIAVCPTD
jgi:WD40 repeat protein/DNA-binding SARP family transcriptional activator/DNA polymerase III delta prime subunit